MQAKRAGRLALLMDGGYVIKRLQKTYRRFPTGEAVRTLAIQLRSQSGLDSQDLYRVFFYHADPYRGSHRHPFTGEQIEFDSTRPARNHDRLLKELEISEDFAVRRGELAFRGWRVSSAVQRALPGDSEKDISPEDFVPVLAQKGVDMRIGLDIAALALKRLVNTVVLVTGDADMVPAMRFARREGLRVGLCPMGFDGIRRELRAHADFVLGWKPESGPVAADGPVPVSPVSNQRRFSGVP